MHSTSTKNELLPLAGLTHGPVQPHYPSHPIIQRLLPPLKAGDLHAVLLTGVPGGGKTVLATELTHRLAAEGFTPLALAATPFQPLSTGRILAAFETAFLHHGLHDEWEIVCDPLIQVEDRLGVVTAVMNKKCPFVLLLDGLESCLDPKTGHFLEPAMGAFFAFLLDQTKGRSRILMTSRIAPEVHGPGPLPEGCQQEVLPPYKAPAKVKKRARKTQAPNPATALTNMTHATQTRVMPLAVFHYPVSVAGYGAVLEASTEETRDLLQRLSKDGLAGCHTVPDKEPLWYLHPHLRTAADQTAQSHPEDQKIHHMNAGKYLATLVQENCWIPKDSQNPHQTGHTPLGLHWLDVALEAVGHFLHVGAFEEALNSAKPISDYFSQRSLLWEQETLNRKLLALREHPRPLYQTAMVLLKHNNQAEAQHLLERVLTFDEDRFPRESALALFDLAALIMRQQPSEARAYLLRSLAINQRHKDRSGQAVCQAHLGFLGLQQNEHHTAQGHLEAALTLCRELHDTTGMANLLPWTGELLWRVGNIASARSHFQEALTLLGAQGNDEVEAQLHHRLAIIDLGEERFFDALKGLLRSLEIRKTSEDKKGEASSFFQLGRLAKAMGNQEASLRFLGLCQCIDQEIGDPDAARELTLFHEIAATAMGLDRIKAQAVLRDVWRDYNKDGGQALIANTFRA